MTKADIVNLVFEKLGLPKNEAHEIVEVVFDTIKQALVAGESIKISGFGSFKVRKKGVRVGRNPKTGKEIEITPRRVVIFKVSNRIKELVEKL